MGFVHISGKAESAQLLSSPLTKTPCCFYRVEIDQWKTHDRSSRWEHICTDADGYRFYVEDATGRVLVDRFQIGTLRFTQVGPTLSLAVPASPPGVPPAGDAWVHEVKWDGVRLLAPLTDAAIDAGDAAQVKDALRSTISLVDKMAGKGIIHRNTAGRYKSRLASRIARKSATA